MIKWTGLAPWEPPASINPRPNTQHVSVRVWTHSHRDPPLASFLPCGKPRGSASRSIVFIQHVLYRSVSETGSYLRLIVSCITQLKAQGPSRTCNESKEEVLSRSASSPLPQTLHPVPRTPNPKPQTSNSTPWTPNPEPRTLNPDPRTPRPEPCTLNPRPD